MAKVEIYTKSWCPFCARAKADLQQLDIPYSEVDVTTDPLREREMINRSARHTVPQIFVNGRHLGGSDDLRHAIATGRLDGFLSSNVRGEAA